MSESPGGKTYLVACELAEAWPGGAKGGGGGEGGRVFPVGCFRWWWSVSGYPALFTNNPHCQLLCFTCCFSLGCPALAVPYLTFTCCCSSNWQPQFGCSSQLLHLAVSHLVVTFGASNLEAYLGCSSPSSSNWAAPYPVASPLLFLTWIPYEAAKQLAASLGPSHLLSFGGSMSILSASRLAALLWLLRSAASFCCFLPITNIHDCSLPHESVGLFLAYIYTFGRFLYNTAATILFFLPYSCYHFE